MPSIMSIYSRRHPNPKQYIIVKTSQLKKINRIPAMMISGKCGEENADLLNRTRSRGLKSIKNRKEMIGILKIAILFVYQITSVPLHCIGICSGKEKNDINAVKKAMPTITYETESLLSFGLLTEYPPIK